MEPKNTESRLGEGRLSEGLLSETLGRLARQSQRSAPPAVGATLLDAFRRRHAARRRAQTMRIATMAALFCLAAGLPLMTKILRPQHIQVAASVQSPMPPTPATDRARPGPEINRAAGSAQLHRRQIHRTRPTRADQRAEQSSDFMVLPGWSSATPREQLRIVRLELPASALRMVGAPVSQEVTERPVLADFVVGQDGTPYAMRLVQQ